MLIAVKNHSERMWNSAYTHRHGKDSRLVNFITQARILSQDLNQFESDEKVIEEKQRNQGYLTHKAKLGQKAIKAIMQEQDKLKETALSYYEKYYTKLLQVPKVTADKLKQHTEFLNEYDRELKAVDRERDLQNKEENVDELQQKLEEWEQENGIKEEKQDWDNYASMLENARMYVALFEHLFDIEFEILKKKYNYQKTLQSHYRRSVANEPPDYESDRFEPKAIAAKEALLKNFPNEPDWLSGPGSQKNGANKKPRPKKQKATRGTGAQQSPNAPVSAPRDVNTHAQDNDVKSQEPPETSARKGTKRRVKGRNKPKTIDEHLGHGVLPKSGSAGELLTEEEEKKRAEYQEQQRNEKNTSDKRVSGQKSQPQGRQKKQPKSKKDLLMFGQYDVSGHLNEQQILTRIHQYTASQLSSVNNDINAQPEPDALRISATLAIIARLMEVIKQQEDHEYFPLPFAPNTARLIRNHLIHQQADIDRSSPRDIKTLLRQLSDYLSNFKMGSQRQAISTFTLLQHWNELEQKAPDKTLCQDQIKLGLDKLDEYALPSQHPAFLKALAIQYEQTRVAVHATADCKPKWPERKINKIRSCIRDSFELRHYTPEPETVPRLQSRTETAAKSEEPPTTPKQQQRPDKNQRSLANIIKSYINSFQQQHLSQHNEVLPPLTCLIWSCLQTARDDYQKTLKEKDKERENTTFQHLQAQFLDLMPLLIHDDEYTESMDDQKTATGEPLSVQQIKNQILALEPVRKCIRKETIREDAIHCYSNQGDLGIWRCLLGDNEQKLTQVSTALEQVNVAGHDYAALYDPRVYAVLKNLLETEIGRIHLLYLGENGNLFSLPSIKVGQMQDCHLLFAGNHVARLVMQSDPKQTTLPPKKNYNSWLKDIEDYSKDINSKIEEFETAHLLAASVASYPWMATFLLRQLRQSLGDGKQFYQMHEQALKKQFDNTKIEINGIIERWQTDVQKIEKDNAGRQQPEETYDEWLSKIINYADDTKEKIIVFRRMHPSAQYPILVTTMLNQLLFNSGDEAQFNRNIEEALKKQYTDTQGTINDIIREWKDHVLNEKTQDKDDKRPDAVDVDREEYSSAYMAANIKSVKSYISDKDPKALKNIEKDYGFTGVSGAGNNCLLQCLFNNDREKITLARQAIVNGTKDAAKPINEGDMIDYDTKVLNILRNKKHLFYKDIGTVTLYMYTPGPGLILMSTDSIGEGTDIVLLHTLHHFTVLKPIV